VVQTEEGYAPSFYPAGAVWKKARSEKVFQMQACTLLVKQRFLIPRRISRKGLVEEGPVQHSKESRKRSARMATTKSEPQAEHNLDGSGAPPIPWTKIRERLEQGVTQVPGSGGPDRQTSWLATVHPDGRPHVMPPGVDWMDGALSFSTGANTRKAKNLAHTPQCVLTVATHDFDIVVEGRARRVTDPALVARIAKRYQAQGWPATVSDDGVSLTAEYSAPSAGPPPSMVYEVTPETVFALGTTGPYGATSVRV
jgi:pyridoxine/pyridoxamine 5'-phosphate oxidase